MAKPTQMPGSSMEDIVSSIRGMMGTDKSSSAEDPAEAHLAAGNELSTGNVSKLFAEDPSQPEADPLGPDGAGTLTDVTPNAIDQSGKAESAEPVEADETLSDVAEPVATGAQSEEWLPSPSADDDAGGRGQLASAMSANTSRTVEQMAEEMMRPLLKNWLDENLPPLVERLVREEIERVSRRR